MPSEARRLHPFTVASKALTLARQLLFPAVVGGISAGRAADAVETTILWIGGILAVSSLGLAVAQWLAFRFRLEGDELILDSGVLSRRRRVIPIARIQNIDLERSALERLAGVAQLRIETASGGRETEASLQVLAVDEARAVREELLRRRAAGLTREAPPADPGAVAADPGAVGPAESGREPSRVLLRLSPVDLMIAGATSNEAGLIAAGLATLLQFVDDFGVLGRVEDLLEPVYGAGTALGVAGALIAALLFVVFFVVSGWVVSVFAHVVRYFGFTLTREGDDLRREYGLLTRHHSTVPLERVQAVRIEETVLRRPLGLAAMKIETAGAGPRQQGEGRSGGAEAFVPIARRRDVGRLLREVFEDAAFEGTVLNPVAPVSLRRGFVRLAVPLALIAAAAGLAMSPSWLWLLVLMAPALLLARAQYRARGWARSGRYAIARSGVLTRSTWVVPVRKIQTLHSTESPFQRRWAIATVLIDTAAGGRVARIVDLERGTAIGLLSELAREGEAARRAALRSTG